jgi:hypothetical protein
MLTDHDDRAIARIAAGVMDCSLPRAEWTHAAHFALALWLLRHRPELTGEPAIGAIIRRYNLANGTPNSDTEGYHATITIASMRAAAAELARHSDDAALAKVLAALLAAPHGRSDWLLVHWTRERLFAVAARRGWVPPDLAPLPF